MSKGARPVTIGLMTYNQEDTVADAVSSVLGQCYSNLEVLISDDCSSDQTFSIIERVVSAYDGPHLVRVFRQKCNLGISGNLNFLMRQAQGQIFVVSAGDDVSLETRCETLERAFVDGVVLAHSVAVSPSGRLISLAVGQSSSGPNNIDPLSLLGRRSFYIGATGAWTTAFWNSFGPIPMPDLWEDQVLGFRASLVGQVAFVDIPLVVYSDESGISTRRITTYSDWKSSREAYFQRLLNTLECNRRDALVSDSSAAVDISEKVDREVVLLNRRLRASRSSLLRLFGFSPKICVLEISARIFSLIRFSLRFR